MKKACLLAVFVLILSACFSLSSAVANGYDRSYLEEQIDEVISQIRNNNNAMHYLANEYRNAALRMGGFPQWKLDTLKWYLENVSPAAPIVDHWPRRR